MLGWLKGRLHRGPTASKHECSNAKDWGGAQHYGHGDQLDVSDSSFSGGTQWDHYLKRGHLGEDCQCAYDFALLSVCSVHLSMQHVLIVNLRKKERIRDERFTLQKKEGTKKKNWEDTSMQVSVCLFD